MRDDLIDWFNYTGKPVLLADIGNWCPTKLNPGKKQEGIDSQRDRAEGYRSAISQLIEEPWFLGWHWCAYVENNARGWGLKDPWDEEYADLIMEISTINKSVYDNIDIA
jgi:hypothetical protein